MSLGFTISCRNALCQTGSTVECENKRTGVACEVDGTSGTCERTPPDQLCDCETAE